MNILIIEDEQLTAEDLNDLILEAEPTAKISAILSSVSEAIQYFEHGGTADLIFSDIQLGDGLSFEIFSKINLKTPIIFCTAYDEYAMNAFQTNGIHYILKPFDLQAIKQSLQKYKALQQTFSPLSPGISELLRSFQHQDTIRPSSLLVHERDAIIPVKMEHIALFYIKNEVTHLYTFTGKVYTISKKLDEIMQLTGNDFFRANRQFIVNRTAVKEASQYLSRKLSLSLTIPFSESITVSKEKLPQLLEWLAG